MDSGYTQTDELLDNLTKQMALLAQSFRATLPQTNNQLQTSSNTRNQATIQDGWVVVQNVQGRHNQNQRYFAWGNGTAGNGGAQNRAGNANASQGKLVKCYNCNGVGHIARNYTQSANPQAGPFNASILSEVYILGNAIDHSISNQDKREVHNKVQPLDVIDTTSVHMGNSNIIPYEQYLLVNDISGVPSCASSALNSVCVSPVNDAFIPHDPIVTELKIYNEHVAIYEQRAKFELTEREQRMDDQM
ncbi:retrovirus-related pol polyprotein from transposon TNT 1-94, partial [Tanacetum coccineum]